jgi:hypothetical protein
MALSCVFGYMRSQTALPSSPISLPVHLLKACTVAIKQKKQD